MGVKFLVRQGQLEDKLKEWSNLQKPYMKIDAIESYSKYKVYAVTFTDFSVSDEHKKTLYISQPHAHEPATTAGMINVMEQLITGKDLMGKDTPLDIEKVVSNLIITFNPIGNPYGTERAPVQYWDGSKYTNEEFWRIMFGEDPEHPGQVWKRLGLWDIREEKAPDPIGIVYEPIDEYRYVEPNRSQQSSYFKLFHKMNAVYAYTYWLELHQTEFVHSEYNCMILLPPAGNAPEPIEKENTIWAGSTNKAWLERGFKACEPRPSGYTGQQAQYFRENYSAINQKTSRITTEVKNNAQDFPAEMQLKANTEAIIASINYLLNPQGDSSQPKAKSPENTL